MNKISPGNVGHDANRPGRAAYFQNILTDLSNRPSENPPSRISTLFPFEQTLFLTCASRWNAFTYIALWSFHQYTALWE